MEFKFDNNVPIYVQLVEQLKNDIISSKYVSGERLPSVREFAIMMRVNPNTMQKALSELENMGLVYTERTNGKYVTTDKKLINNLKKEIANELSKKYFISMENIGFNRDDVFEYIKKYEGDK